MITRIVLLLMLSFPLGDKSTVTIKPLALTDYASIWNDSGETVIVNFWATWCASCIKEIPDLVAFSKAHELPLKFVSLDRPKKIENAQRLLASRGVDGTHYLLNASDEDLSNIMPDWYGAVPLTIVYRQGKVVKVFDRQVSEKELTQIKNILKQ